MTDNPCWWHVYILDVDNRGRKSKYFGYTRLFYTGITHNMAHRMADHLWRQHNSFIQNNFSKARKKLVYVEYVFGTRSDAELRERAIKQLGHTAKEQLVLSNKNALIHYSWGKIVLRKPDGQGEVVLKF